MLLRAGQSLLEPRLVTVTGGTQTDSEPHQFSRWAAAWRASRRSPGPSLARHRSYRNRLVAAFAARPRSPGSAPARGLAASRTPLPRLRNGDRAPTWSTCAQRNAADGEIAHDRAALRPTPKPRQRRRSTPDTKHVPRLPGAHGSREAVVFSACARDPDERGAAPLPGVDLRARAKGWRRARRHSSLGATSAL